MKFPIVSPIFKEGRGYWLIKFWSSSHPAQVYGQVFVKSGILVKKSLFFRTGEKFENFNQYQNEHSCLWKWMSDMGIRLKWSLWKHVYDVKQTFRKKPQFQKIRKLQNLFHFNEQGISCIESLAVLNLRASPKCCKRMEQSWLLAYGFMGRWT